MQASNGIPQQVTVVSVHEEVPGVKTFTVAYDDGSSFSYRAGQFITLVFNHTGTEERRSYSISSLPDNPKRLSFTVKRVANGICSRWLTDIVKVGDKLFTTGISGFFCIPDSPDEYKQVIFFGAGIGITPMIPMIQWLLKNRPDAFVTLIYSNRTQPETAFYEQLTLLLRQYPGRLSIEFLYSTSFNLLRARLNKSLTTTLLNEYLRVPASETLFYVCGPTNYMRMVTYALTEYGIDKSRIKKEIFNKDNVGFKASKPDDTDTHTVTISVGNRVFTFATTYPDTILSAAKKNGLSMPYSCETGLCGSCAAICTSGKMWHAHNEVLTDSDLREGRILTCTATPIDGDVSIVI